MQSRQIEDKFMLRLPEGWREQIKITAAQERRSMNAEILNYIERGMRISPETKKGEVTA